MNIQLQQVVPIPLRDKVQQRTSDVWNSHVSFAKGEWVKIKAPSGTGKTTLVHTLYKLRNDYSGAVQYDGTELRQLSADKVSEYRQQKVSVVFQDMRLFANLTARENIELKRIMYKPVYEEQVIDQMAERLGIPHILKQTAATCSYGEQQRVAIIRSLMQPFDWLIMDEPFSHLDAGNTRKAAELIAEECRKRGAGFILMDLDEDEHFTYTRKLLL
jgi:ABC-type lipoprotein export system ATPase subunit